jgi:hypothetical protein
MAIRVYDGCNELRCRTKKLRNFVGRSSSTDTIMTNSRYSLAIAIALLCGCEQPKGPAGFPEPARQCTPEDQQESSECGFYAFEFQGKKSHLLMADQYTGDSMGGDKTMCGCNTKLLSFVDAARSQDVEPIIKQSCHCTRKAR